MKILIAQSYFRVLDPKEMQKNMPYPPLGALYAGSILKENHEVVFFDSMLADNPEELNKIIIKEKPDLFLIYDDEFNYLTKMCLSNMREAAVSFIKTAVKNSIPTIVYSSDATDFSKPYFDGGCNSIIYGEGEITLKEVTDSFAKNEFETNKENIPGLKFLKNGKVFSTTKRELIKDINLLPDPDYSFVDITKYREIWIKNHGFFSLNMSTTRGCPYKCNWCAKPLYGKTYNSVSPQKAANQIKNLKEKYFVDHIWITDDIFGLKPNWIKEFSEELKKLNIKIPYKCLSRPDLLLKGSTIEDLKSSGCKTIWIGAESGSQKILDAMDKGTKTAQIYEASKKVKEAGMEISFFIQFGYLSEDWNDINLTRKMIRACNPDDIGISVSYPLPGTKFYENVKILMSKKTNWKDSDDLDLMFTGTYGRNFYKLLHRFIHAEYRISKFFKNKKTADLPKFFNNVLKYIYFRLKLNLYLKVSR